MILQLADAILLHPALRRGYVPWPSMGEAGILYWASHWLGTQRLEGVKLQDSYGTCGTGYPWKGWPSNVGGSKYIIAALTKMSLSASSIRVTLLFSFFIHPWANLFLNKNKGRTRIDWQFKPAYVAASRIANIFSIPPMSTESERVFSGARRTIFWDKTRLGSNVVEYSECLKSWVSVLKGKRRPLLAAVFGRLKRLTRHVEFRQLLIRKRSLKRWRNREIFFHSVSTGP